MGRAGVGHLSGAREIGHEGPQAMQGAPKRQVNAEEMLAELKRAVESSTRAPDAPPPSASTAPKSSSPGRETRRSQIDRGSDRPVKANADSSIGQPTDLQKSTRPRSRRWKLIAGGLALAGAATICVSFALMNKAPDLPEREPSVAATESLVRPQNEQTLEPSSSPRAPMQDSPQAVPLQAGNSWGESRSRPPNLASSGLESTAPAFTPVPPSSPAVWVPSQRIRPDGTPIATAPSAPAPTDSAHPAETPKPAVQTAAPQAVKPDKASLATSAVHSRFDRFSASSGSGAEAGGPVGRPANAQAGQGVNCDSAVHSRFDQFSASSAETPKPAAPAAPQMLKPDEASVATASPTPASTDSASPPAQTPKPNATQTASVSTESAEPSTPKIDLKKKPAEKIAQQKPAKSPKPPVKPIAQAERRSTEPAPPKEAEKSPQPAQAAGNPTALAPVPATSVQQRFADGMTHAFGYLMHLPGALVPHLGGSDADAH